MLNMGLGLDLGECITIRREAGTAHDRDTARLRLITSCLRFRVASRESSESGNLDFYTPRSSGSGGRKKAQVAVTSS